MIHGYHVILPTYGFWLPNDPRGSWSDMIRKWELLRFGPATKGLGRKSLEELAPAEITRRDAARAALKYPPVTLTGQQAASIGRGFADKAARSNYTIWACSILPEHTHLVIARHTYKVEQIANLLKGAATSQLIEDNNHPLTIYAQPNKPPPRMWAEHEWKVYLDSDEAIDNAVVYVEQNPEKEGKPKQSWKFVTPFAGLPKGGWVTYH